MLNFLFELTTQKTLKLGIAGHVRCSDTGPLITQNAHTCWRYMETFSVLQVFYDRNPPVTGGFPSQRSCYAELRLFFADSLPSCWTNNRVADEFRCSCDVAVMNYDRNFLFVIPVHPMIMHPVRALIYFVVVWYWLMLVKFFGNIIVTEAIISIWLI